MDPLLEAYVAAVERQLGRHLGREHVLSPPDFQLAQAWHSAGLPLASLLAGVDAAFAAGFGPRSLQACRRFVERDWRAQQSGRQPVEAPSDPREPLAELLARLEALVAEGWQAFAPCAREARALLAAIEEPERARRLETLRQAVATAARAVLDADQELEARREALPALRRHAGLPEPERAAALERHVTRRALQRLGLLELL